MSDGAATAESGTSTVPTQFPDPSASAPEAPDFTSLIPAEFKEKPWVQDISKNENPFKALFEQHDHAQSLIGRKSTSVEVPGEGASEESIKAFYKALGAPEKPEEYEITSPDLTGLPEKVQLYLGEEAKDRTLFDSVAQKAVELGITKKQLAGIVEVVDGWKIENAKGAVEAAEALAEKQASEQKQKFTGYYGAKADHVRRVAEETAKKVLPKEIMDMQDPDIALFEAMRYIHEHVFKNDSVSPGVPDSSSIGDNVEQLRAKLMKLRSEPGYRNAWAPDHKALNQQVDELYEEISRLEREKQQG